ncbi:MAG TPA: hypothetical protein VFH51_19885 [Myxococcota bacterium]|nr:hypothetical protein [Myxococcota bacterium]
MLDPRPATCLELLVGPYALALRAAVVLQILEAVPAGEPFTFRQRRWPLCDLGEALAGGRRAVVPFALVLEAAGEGAVIGVDRIAHVAGTPVPAALPTFGLARPDLFEAALRHQGRLLLLLSPAALVAYVRARP